MGLLFRICGWDWDLALVLDIGIRDPKIGTSTSGWDWITGLGLRGLDHARTEIRDIIGTWGLDCNPGGCAWEQGLGS